MDLSIIKQVGHFVLFILNCLLFIDQRSLVAHGWIQTNYNVLSYNQQWNIFNKREFQ
jgi:hypothetical protein